MEEKDKLYQCYQFISSFEKKFSDNLLSNLLCDTQFNLHSRWYRK